MDRLCLDCGNPVKGRADKKFCDDLCRNNYNNHLKAEDNAIVKAVNLILKRNRSILSKFNPDGKAKITRNKLISAGFNFNYHTSIHLTHNGNTYIFCYEFGYLAIGELDILIVKKE
ncbi:MULTISPECIES: hypothetical protein [unclassified Pedobacter]|uniref:hypothetical protein n=1 Tax=unclassified Pedobacter TaxID=2628915 RepID=UPI001E3C088D|nr:MULTISPECIES: hypothetical protein [unclassified Pedobacter]